MINKNLCNKGIIDLSYSCDQYNMSAVNISWKLLKQKVYQLFGLEEIFKKKNSRYIRRITDSDILSNDEL
jgi:hypothetical protein